MVRSKLPPLFLLSILQITKILHKASFSSCSAPLRNLLYTRHIFRTKMNDILKALVEKEAELDSLKERAKTLTIEINLLRNLSGKPMNEAPELPGKPVPDTVKTLAQKYRERPDISLADAARKGAPELGEFTKRDLQNWIEKAYPTLGTKLKSLDRVIYLLMEDEKIVVFKKSLGGRRPTIYKWRNGEK